MDLTNQRVVIMGGSSGIGLATARMLVDAGANVAITGRNQHKLNAAVAHLGERVSGAVVDATSLPHLHSFFHKYGPFQHLVIALSGSICN